MGTDSLKNEPTQMKVGNIEGQTSVCTLSKHDNCRWILGGNKKSQLSWCHFVFHYEEYPSDVLRRDDIGEALINAMDPKRASAGLGIKAKYGGQARVEMLKVDDAKRAWDQIKDRLLDNEIEFKELKKLPLEALPEF